jgi:hypothetical protein
MKRRQFSDQFQRPPYITLTLGMSSGEASQFSMYPQEPQTWRTGLTAAKMFHRLTLIRFPAPPGSRFPGTRMMSLDWHLGHRFLFFIDTLSPCHHRIRLRLCFRSPSPNDLHTDPSLKSELLRHALARTMQRVDSGRRLRGFGSPAAPTIMSEAGTKGEFVAARQTGSFLGFCCRAGSPPGTREVEPEQTHWQGRNAA